MSAVLWALGAVGLAGLATFAWRLLRRPAMTDVGKVASMVERRAEANSAETAAAEKVRADLVASAGELAEAEKKGRANPDATAEALGLTVKRGDE